MRTIERISVGIRFTSLVARSIEIKRKADNKEWKNGCKPIHGLKPEKERERNKNYNFNFNIKYLL